MIEESNCVTMDFTVSNFAKMIPYP